MDDNVNTQSTGNDVDVPVRRNIKEVSAENTDFANGRGDVCGARGAESSADIIMSESRNCN